MAGSGWEFNDALFLVALGALRQGSDLSELIASADAHNHDVLPAEDAARAVGRLIASGLVEDHGERWRMTALGKRMYKRRRGGMFEQADSVLAALNEVELSEGGPAFTSEAYDAAYEAYSGRISRWFKRS